MEKYTCDYCKKKKFGEAIENMDHDFKYCSDRCSDKHYEFLCESMEEIWEA